MTGPVFRTIAIRTDKSIEDVAVELREIFNAESRNRDPFVGKQERNSMNYNGRYWLFGLLDDIEVVLMHSDDPGSLEIIIDTTDFGFAEPLAAKLARVLFHRGYTVSVEN